MKQYILVGLLTWIGTGYSGFFYDGNPILAKQTEFENKIRLIFLKKYGVGRTESIINRIESLIEEINTANLDTAAKKSLARTILEAINNDTGLEGKNYDHTIDEQLKVIKINLNNMSTATKNEEIPDKNDEDADATDLDDQTNPDTQKKINEFTQIGKNAVQSKKENPKENKNDWFKNQNATIKNVVDGLTATYITTENAGTKMQLKATIESYIKSYLQQKHSLWQQNDNPENFVNRLEDAQSIIMLEISNYAGKQLNDIDAKILSDYTKNIVNETIKDYVTTIKEATQNKSLSDYLEKHPLFHQPQKPLESLTDSSNPKSEKTNEDVQELQKGYQESITKENQQEHEKQIQKESLLQKLKKKAHVPLKKTIDYLTKKAKNLKDAVKNLLSSRSSSNSDNTDVDTSGDDQQRKQAYKEEQQGILENNGSYDPSYNNDFE